MNRLLSPLQNSPLALILITSCLIYSCGVDSANIDTKSYTIVSGPIQYSGIDVLAFSPDGSKLLAGCRDQSAKLIDMSTNPGKVLQKMSHSGAVHAVAFSENGSKMYSGSVDGVIKQWDSKTYGFLSQFNLNSQMGDKANSIYSMKEDHKILVSGMTPTAKIIDLNANTLIQSFPNHGQIANEAIFTKDELKVVSSSINGSFRVWDTQTGKEIKTVQTADTPNPQQTRPLEWVGLSPNETQIITAGIDTTVKVYDLRTYRLLHTLQGHERGVKYTAFLPDGKRVVSAGLDQKVILWDVATEKELAGHKQHNRPILSGALSPDGKKLATGDIEGKLVIWELP